MQVFLSSNTQENIDIYRLKIGVRSLHWSSKEFLINGKPIYFRGFGRHEDSDVSNIGRDSKTAYLIIKHLKPSGDSCQF